MDRSDFNNKVMRIGVVCCWGAFLLGITYIITTILGFMSLKTPDDQIGDPFFTMMELLILLIAPLMAMSIIVAHFYAAPKDKIYSMFSAFFMVIMMGITSCVHFVMLTLGRYIEFSDPSTFDLYFSFTWPSVVYVLDILAWDWFFALSFFFIAPVFKRGRLENVLKTLLIVGGILSLAGFIGIPLENMQVRNLGILGYAIVAPLAFLLMGFVFKKRRK